VRTLTIAGWEAFRGAARRLLAEGVAPADVALVDAAAGGDALPWGGTTEATAAEVRAPRAYVALAARVACHRDADRWNLLYRLLFRLIRGEGELLAVATDPDVARAHRLDAAVRRARHKLTAFVRFQRVAGAEGDEYVAWYVPEHPVLALATDFFVERFGVMRWWILTPDASAHWDRHALHLGPGVGAREARARLAGDDLEDLWRAYYANVFNPARVKVAAMVREMPRRHWATLPEADLIASLLAEAPARAAAMVDAAVAASAGPWVPPGRRSLAVLRAAARGCRGCELCDVGAQTVFGEGADDAPMVLVGEQPGDAEDRAGTPFVGPAGQVLRRALAAAGVPTERLYLTNAVKHFRHRVDGPRRLHETPRARDVAACKPWLDAELATLAPRVVVALGATAGRALLGPLVRADARGRWAERAGGATVAAMLTWHPSAALRDPAGGAAIEAELAEHLRAAWARAAREGG
jgi:probable DNA metabolism protein